MGWLRTALRRLRDERLAALGLAALVLVTGFLFGIAPRALDAVADDVLLEEVGSVAPVTRNIQFVEETRIPPPRDGEDPMAAIAERGEALDEQLPASVRELITTGGWQVESGRYELNHAGDPQFARLRFQEGIDDQVRYVEGRPPTGATELIDDVMVDLEEFDDVVVYEVALARSTAETFRMAVGDVVSLVTDPRDPLVGRGQARVAAMRLVGTYDVLDPDAEYWLGDRLLQQVVIRSITLETRFFDGAALLSPDAYPAFLAADEQFHPPVRYTWRRFIDPNRLDTETLDALLVELRRTQAEFPSVTPTSVYETGYRTGLLGVLEQQRARWASATAILTVVALGPAAVAAAALGLVALLAAQRRRAALSVSRSRGASVVQLVSAVVAEGILLTVPAVAVAAAVALLLIPGGPSVPTLLAAVGVAALTTAFLVATSVPSASLQAGRGGRDTGIVRPPTPRRLVFEALLVVLALGGAWLLRERGVRGASATGTLEAADPLIAAVPALVGLAAGLLAVRLFPLPMRLLAGLAAARRDLVPVLAMRRATSGAGVGPVLIVLLATATIGAFSSAALVHLERSAETVAWQEIGASYRVTAASGALPGTLDADALPEVEASAGVFRTTATIDLSGPRVEIVIVDAPAFQRVVEGTPADPGLPAQLLGPTDGPIPAIVSASLGTRPDGVTAGEEFRARVEAYDLRYRAAAVRDAFPGVPAGSHFVVVSRDHFLASAPSAGIRPGTVLLRAPDAVGEQLRAAALEIVSGGTVEGRAERTAQLRRSPVVGAVRLGIVAAAVVAAAYAALAVAAALALAGLARAVEVAHLRTLGLTRREAFGLVVVEHGPTVIAAFSAGVGLGLALFMLLRQGLGLSALVGSVIEVPLTVEAGQLLLVLAAIVTIVVMGLGIGAAFQRAAAPVAAIRRGFE